MKYLVNKVKEFVGMPRFIKKGKKKHYTRLTKADIKEATKHYTPPTPEERLAAKRARRKVKRQIQRLIAASNRI